MGKELDLGVGGAVAGGVGPGGAVPGGRAKPVHRPKRCWEKRYREGPERYWGGKRYQDIFVPISSPAIGKKLRLVVNSGPIT